MIIDLDSVIKSFEEKIIFPGQESTSSVLDLTPDAALNELGYRLEVSDDDGPPQSFTNSADKNINPKITDLPDISSSAFSMPHYNIFDLGPKINNNVSSKEAGNEEFVTLGFDFIDNERQTWYYFKS